MRFWAALPRGRLILAVLGTLQGLTYTFIVDSNITVFWGRTISAALWAFVTVTGLILQYTWDATHRRRLCGISLLFGLLFAALTVWVWSQMPESIEAYDGDDTRLPTWGIAALLALHVLLPFVQIGHRRSRWFFPYSELFQHSWNNVLIALVAACFTAACWVVVSLWAALFTMIGIAFFSDVFFSRPFVLISLMTFVGYGLTIGRDNATIINTLRRITVTICHLLLPFLSAIALLFLVALPFTGLQTLWNTKQASMLLLGLAGLTILFINAVFQDGHEPTPYAPWLRHTVEAALLALPVWSVLAGMAVALRIHQYGLTPERFYVVILVGIVSGYALGYSLAVLGSRQGWLSAIRAVNVPMALLVILLALLMHTPVLDALRWSARSQYTRLAEGRVDAAAFDYAFLRFKLGHVGARALTQLAQLSEHPQAGLIQQRVAFVRQANSYWDANRKPEVLLDVEHLVRIDTTEAPVPEELFTVMNHSIPDYERRSCKTAETCVLLAINLDDDAALEYLVLIAREDPQNFSIGYGFDRSPEGPWQGIGEFYPQSFPNDRNAILSALRQTGASPILPQYRDVAIGTSVFERRR